MQEDLISFLETFRHTGIYIVDRTSMEVYFENETARKYTEKDRIGQACFLAHGNKSMCASCPLRREDRTSYVIREDHGMIFCVEAMDTQWQGKEAYMIMVRKQSNIPHDNKISEEMTERMGRALATSVMQYCEINMKTFQAKSVRFSGMNKNYITEANYEDHLRDICNYYVHPEDRAHVTTVIGLEKLKELSEDSTGPTEISVRYRSNDTGQTKMIKSTAYILRNELPHYVSIITKEVTNEENLSIKLQLYNEVVKNSVSVCHFNLSTNECISVDGEQPIFSHNEGIFKNCCTMDDFCGAVVDRIQEGQWKKGATDFFCRERLIEEYHAGQTIAQHRFPIQMEEATYKWFLISINMIDNPISREVEAMMHSEEIEDTIVKDNLIAQVIHNDYDYIMLIDMQKNKARSFTNYGLYKPYETNDAEAYIERYVREAYVGDDIEDFVKRNKFRYIQRILEEEDTYVEYYNIKDKDGRVRYKKGTFSYSNGDTRYIIFTREDVTEIIESQNETNHKLEAALKQSDQANKAKLELFSRMSHDLRTPMNAIVGMANLGREESKEETIGHYFEKIDSSGNYLLGLINDILDMNRLEYGKVELHEEPVEVRKFFDDVIEMMQPLIQQKKIQLLTDFVEMRTGYFYCDPVRTRQIYVNFLSNSIKFSAPGSIIEWIAREDGIEDGRVYYEMRFVDHGCGMSKEFTEHVFEPFVQEKNEYSSENQSIGLGLAITKNLVQTMGGDISVLSELGQGSVFVLHLNHRIAKEQETKKIPNKIDYLFLKGKKVLAVEDHPLNLEIEKKLLQKVGMEIISATNGKIAVEQYIRYGRNYFDAILMDVRMPIMDGLEATRRIRSLKREDAQIIPIIATTANAFEEDRRASKEAGMNAHLSKPIEPKVLYQTLQQEIEASQY